MTYGKAILIAILFATAFTAAGTLDYNSQLTVLSR
jgi:hypothetical protein